MNIAYRDDFYFSRFNFRFNSTIVQSVFTHPPWNTILRYFVKMKRGLAGIGKFYAAFFEDKRGRHATTTILVDSGGIVTFIDKESFHHIFSTFEKLGSNVDLKVNLVGNWNHPRNQQITVFTHGK